MNTVERLERYYPFESTVVETVAENLEHQRRYGSYSDFFEAKKVGEPFTFSANQSGMGVKMIDVRPQEHDPEHAVVVCLPMANPLDTNQLYQLANLADALPSSRLVAMGNPSVGKYKSGTLDTRGKRALTAIGGFANLTYPLQRYIEDQKIQRISLIGYSLGTLLAGDMAARGLSEVEQVLYVEPVGAEQTSLLGLTLAFNRSAKALKGYVEANALPTFEAARKDGIGMGQFTLSLLIPTNIATARGIAHGSFEDFAYDARLVHPNMKATYSWGTASELCSDSLVGSIAIHDQIEAPVGRSDTIRLEGQKHALFNDLALAQAIVLQSAA